MRRDLAPVLDQARKPGRTPVDSVLTLSGSLPHFEALLGNPPWFREGTSLPRNGSAIPQWISIADDLRMVSNICQYGALPAVLKSMMASSRPPFARGWLTLMSVAPDVSAALDFAIRETSISNPYFNLSMETIDGETTIKINIKSIVNSEAYTLIYMAPMFLINRIIIMLVNEDLHHCVMEYAIVETQELSELKSMINATLRFGKSETIMRFPAHWLDLPNADSDPQLWQALSRRRLGHGNLQSPLFIALSGMVRNHLLAGEKPRSLAQMAEALGLSERTLVRRLGQLGTSYTEVVDAERREIAAFLIADASLSLKQIAEQLAFSDMQGFARAFRKWHDESPGKYRKRMRMARPGSA